MSFRYNDILNIPERNLRFHKLTKVFFTKNYPLAAAEKKLLSGDISKMEILAQITPSTSNIVEVVNEVDSYENVFIIFCTVEDTLLEKNAEKCINLIQKYLPQQAVVIVEDDSGFKVNATLKRINQNDKSKLTIESSFTTSALSKLYKNDLNDAFYKALDFANLDKTNLELLYKSYIQAIVQFNAASITGTYQKRSNARTAQDMEHLAQIELIERDIISLSSQIKKESQLNNKVQLNIKIQEKRKEISAIKNILSH